MTGKRKIFPGRLEFLFGTPQVPGEALGTRNPPVKARQPPRPHLPNLQGLPCKEGDREEEHMVQCSVTTSERDKAALIAAIRARVKENI